MKKLVIAALCALLASYGVQAGPLAKKIAAKYKVTHSDKWFGGDRTLFVFRGCEAWVIEPENPAAGNPWAWIMEWPHAFPERTGSVALLKAGYRIVTFRPGFYEKGIFQARPGNMNDKRVAESALFHAFVVRELGLAPKANLIGMSWGGFYSTRFASYHPECVAKIYLDAPLLDFSTLPNWSGAHYGVDSKTYVGKDDPRMPVNRAEPIAKAGIPILLVYGAADTTVPPAKNCELFIERFKAAGGAIYVSKRESWGHHPHGYEPGEQQQRFVNFFNGK